MKTYEADLSGVEFFQKYYPKPLPDGPLISRNISYEKMGWQLTTVFCSHELYGDVSFFRIYTIAIGLIASLLTLYVIRKYIMHIADTVLFLRNTMKIENDELHFNISSNDDLDYLNNSFYMMKERIDDLLKDQKQHNTHLLQIQEERRQAEIQAIEAQVNPHFLYNTLNTLNWMAIDREDQEMSRALTDLAGILRYSISRIDTLTSVRDEIDWLKKYLNLQQMRFDNLFDYEINVEEEIADFQIYKLLFQPFIENAIIHGFNGISEKGHLSISLSISEEKDLKIVISDNGRGFNQQTIEKESIGMESTIYRMKLYYQGMARVSCKSEKGRGTTITIIIPEESNETPHY